MFIAQEQIRCHIHRIPQCQILIYGGHTCLICPSGSQRQGVAVARLVNRGGKVFIFVEPTAAMGLNETNAVLKLIRILSFPQTAPDK